MLGGDVGSGLKDRSNGRACGSDGRWSSGSMSSFDDGSRYLAIERRDATRVVASSSQIELCAPILLMCLHWKMCPFLCLPTLVFCFTPSHHCPSTAEPSMAFAEQLAPAFAK